MGYAANSVPNRDTRGILQTVVYTDQFLCYKGVGWFVERSRTRCRFLRIRSPVAPSSVPSGGLLRQPLSLRPGKLNSGSTDFAYGPILRTGLFAHGMARTGDPRWERNCIAEI